MMTKNECEKNSPAAVLCKLKTAKSCFWPDLKAKSQMLSASQDTNDRNTNSVSASHERPAIYNMLHVLHVTNRHSVLKLISKILTNILQNPDEQKYTNINYKTLKSKFSNFKNANYYCMEILFYCGFTESFNDGELRLIFDTNKHCLSKLKNINDFITKPQTFYSNNKSSTKIHRSTLLVYGYMRLAGICKENIKTTLKYFQVKIWKSKIYLDNTEKTEAAKKVPSYMGEAAFLEQYDKNHGSCSPPFEHKCIDYSPLIAIDFDMHY
eukprot:89988_1